MSAIAFSLRSLVDFMRIFKNTLYNLNIILAGIFIVFQILDIYNPTMHFIVNEFSIYLMLAFCAISIINASSLIVKNHKTAKAKTKNQLK